ncbi:MAG TPA: hypothetical protein VIP70_01570 [Nitrososphaeraceae archaeon]
MVIASEWVSAKIPKEISQAIDRYLASKSAQINGVHSRSDFLTRLCVAWFANVEKEFSLFDSSRVSEIFGRTHPPPIHPSELLGPPNADIEVLIKAININLSRIKQSQPYSTNPKLSNYIKYETDNISGTLDHILQTALAYREEEQQEQPQQQRQAEREELVKKFSKNIWPRSMSPKEVEELEKKVLTRYTDGEVLEILFGYLDETKKEEIRKRIQEGIQQKEEKEQERK